MERRRNLLRDYGLALGLVLASVLLFWRTMLPQIQRNRDLDQRLLEVRAAEERTTAERERLRALEQADWDPLVVERMAREIFADLGLPPNEVMVQGEGDGEGS